MADTYANYAALAAAETEDVDYARRTVAVAGSLWSSIAVHGGGIEPGSGEVARHVAVDLMDHYEFAGIKSSGNSILHITSTNFDEPQCLALVAPTTRTLSFHGFTGTGVEETAIGGLDTACAGVISDRLEAAGFTIVAAGEEIDGDDPDNVANRNSVGAGVQLELSYAQRQAFFVGGDLGRANRDAGNYTEAFHTYCAAIAGAFTYAITATTVAVWPPRVTLAVTGLIPGDIVAVGRYVGGVRTWVRGATQQTVSDVAFIAFDAELPYGVDVYYTAEVNYVEVAWTAPTSYTLTGGDAALSDAITAQSAEVIITDMGEKTYDRGSSVFRVGGRTVVVSRDRGMYRAQISLMTETDAERTALSSLLAQATDGILQLRQAGTYSDVDGYLSVLSDTAARLSQDGTDQRRFWTLQVAEVEGWAPELPTLAFTFADFDAAYDGETFDDFDTAFTGETFLDFDLTDWST